MYDVSDFNDESRWLDMTRLTEVKKYDNNLIGAFITTHLPFRIVSIIC
jgi:hypothetical protein